MNELFNSQIITAMLDRIASIPDSSDIDQVMNYIVDIIRDEGNFYYVSLFLVDTAREWAVFRSGNEEYREQFLSKGFKFHLGSSSIVGQAVVEDDLQIFDYNREGCFMSPLLPDTRWELALPLNVEGDIIGVLKIEGADMVTFSYEDAKPIQQVADRIAEKLGQIDGADEEGFDEQKEAKSTQEVADGVAEKLGHRMSDSDLQINGSNLILLPQENTEQNFLDGFWKWIEILASGDYVKATEALYWEREPWKPDKLKHQITTFFSKTEPFIPVIPNQRLINVVNENSEIVWNQDGDGGWAMAQIPVTNEPENSKEDDVPLMGLAASFFVRKHLDYYVLEFEIFHA